MSKAAAIGGRRVFLNTLFSLLGDVGSRLASLALLLVIAHRLGPGKFGTYAYAFSFSAVALTLANFGQDQVLAREVAAKRRLVHRYFANTIGLKIAIALPVLSVALATYWLTAPSREARIVVTIVCAGGVAETMISTCLAVFQAYERLGYVPVVRITERFVTAAGGIVALIRGAGVVAVALMYLAGAILALGIALIAIRTVIGVRIRAHRGEWAALVKSAMPIGIAGVLGSILFRVDMIMLGAFKSASAVGNYGAAYRLLDSTLFVSWSVSAAVYPVFSRLGKVSPIDLGRVLERTLKLLAAVTVPLAVGALALAGPLCSILFGARFSDAPAALRLLAPTMALYPVATLSGLFLVSQYRTRVVTIVYSVLTVENVVANLVLIPPLSLFGAALGTSITELLLVGALLVPVQRLVGRLRWMRVLSGTVVATAAALVPMIVLRHDLVPAFVAGTGVYVGGLAAYERLVFPDDFRMMWGYIRSVLPGGGAAYAANVEP